MKNSIKSDILHNKEFIWEKKIKRYKNDKNDENLICNNCQIKYKFVFIKKLENCSHHYCFYCINSMAFGNYLVCKIDKKLSNLEYKNEKKCIAHLKEFFYFCITCKFLICEECLINEHSIHIIKNYDKKETIFEKITNNVNLNNINDKSRLNINKQIIDNYLENKIKEEEDKLIKSLIDLQVLRDNKNKIMNEYSKYKFLTTNLNKNDNNN